MWWMFPVWIEFECVLLMVHLLEFNLYFDIPKSGHFSL